MRRVAIVLLFIFLSCNGQKKSTTGTTETKNSHSSLSLIASEAFSGTDEETTLVIRDAETLRKFYAKLNRTRKPGIPVPKIDFTEEMVLVYCSGQQNTDIFPKLSIADESENLITIDIENDEAKSSSVPIISPFAVYKMPITTKRIAFKK